MLLPTEGKTVLLPSTFIKNNKFYSLTGFNTLMIASGWFIT